MTKLLSIYIRDIRINKDIQSNDVTAESLRDSERLHNKARHEEEKDVPDFRRAKVPPSILTFAQVKMCGVFMFL